MHEEIMKTLKDLKGEVNTLKAEKGSEAVVAKEDNEISLADDFLDIPVTFFAYSLSFALYGDKRRGKVENTPSGEAIKFEPYYRYNVKNAGKRGNETVSICRATVQSLQTVKWLRDHSQFGIKFFENIKSAIDQDVFLAEKMVQVSNMISNLSDMKVIDRAKSEGINITDPDISNIRQQLIKKIATKQIDQERGAREAVAATLGLKTKGTIGNGGDGEKANVSDVY